MVENKKSGNEEVNALSELLKPKTLIKLKVGEVFSNLPKKFVILFVEKAENFTQTNVEVVRYFVERQNQGVYVAISKPLENIIELLNENKINPEKLVFIDSITNASGGTELSGENYFYVDSPRDLMEIIMLIGDAIKSFNDGEKFVIIDSISTLLMYNSLNAVKKFVHSIAGKLHMWKVKGILVIMEAADKETLSAISQFCDKIVTME